MKIRVLVPIILGILIVFRLTKGKPMNEIQRTMAVVILGIVILYVISHLF